MAKTRKLKDDGESNTYLVDVFGKRGLLAQLFPDYQKRQGQIDLALVVDAAMRGERHMMGEGPCGTGKSIAYCVPAIWHAATHEKRTIIATENIALQEQLCKKDLPFLQGILPWYFTFALLKGRVNYLCLAKLSDAIADDPSFDADGAVQFDHICDWAPNTKTGDVSELPFVPKPRVWAHVATGTSENCNEDCPSFKQCFAERARAIAKESDIVVTNYHQLFAHMEVRAATRRDHVLPPHDFIVADEAHSAAEVARNFLGFDVTERGLANLAGRAKTMDQRTISNSISSSAATFFDDLRFYEKSMQYNCRLREPGFVKAVKLLDALSKLLGVAQRLIQEAADNAKISSKQLAFAKTTGALVSNAIENIESAVDLKDPNSVYWISTEPCMGIHGKPIIVSEILKEELFGKTQSICLVSATLTTGGTFDFVQGETGVPENALKIIAENPFDFQKQALLVIPSKELPDPRDQDFADVVGSIANRVIAMCRGRTLGLFTSYRVLNAVHDQIDAGDFRVLKQGELPRTQLTQIFKDDVSSVLLGTRSFWTGVDVPGESLTGLIIDKLPFPHPGDPVVNAICERDPKSFFNYMIPQAVMTFRQGAGRLIRKSSDRGVIVLLDRRLIDKRYGQVFIDSLPGMTLTKELEAIPAFLE